jgi:hypothetical protein
MERKSHQKPLPRVALPAKAEIFAGPGRGRSTRGFSRSKGRRRTNRHCQIAIPGKSVRSQGESPDRRLYWLSFSRSERTYQAKPGARAGSLGWRHLAGLRRGAALFERGVVGIAVGAAAAIERFLAHQRVEPSPFRAGGPWSGACTGGSRLDRHSPGQPRISAMSTTCVTRSGRSIGRSAQSATVIPAATAEATPVLLSSTARTSFGCNCSLSTTRR